MQPNTHSLTIRNLQLLVILARIQSKQKQPKCVLLFRSSTPAESTRTSNFRRQLEVSEITMMIWTVQARCTRGLKTAKSQIAKSQRARARAREKSRQIWTKFQHHNLFYSDLMQKRQEKLKTENDRNENYERTREKSRLR